MSAWVLQTVVIDFDVYCAARANAARPAAKTGGCYRRRRADPPSAIDVAGRAAPGPRSCRGTADRRRGDRLGGCGQLGGPDASPADEPTVVTSTTKIAGAGVLGNQRRPDESCAPDPPACRSRRPPTRPVRHAAGETVVRGRPAAHRGALRRPARRAVRAGPAVAHRRPPPCPTAPTASRPISAPSSTTCPASGTRSAPDLDAIRAANPDLILGSAGADARRLSGSCRRSPRRCSPAHPAPRGRTTCARSARRPGGPTPPNGLIDDFTAAADKTGADNDATHFQASVVQFTDTTMRVYGPDNFPGSVLADVGVDRPAAQRFTDKPYVEIGITDDGSGQLPRLLDRRRRHRVRVVRLTGGQGPRAEVHGQRRLAQAVRQPGQPGLRRQQRGVADRRGHRRRPRHARRTCAGSTRRSTNVEQGDPRPEVDVRAAARRRRADSSRPSRVPERRDRGRPPSSGRPPGGRFRRGAHHR